MDMSLRARVSRLPAAERAAWIQGQSEQAQKEMARGEWWWTARPNQIPPDGDWFICLMLAGRGFGKTQAGAEWTVEQVLKHPYDLRGTPTEWLVIAETLGDARTICMEGPAGILQVLRRREIKHRYVKSPRPEIRFPSGSKIYTEGADDADVGRGYNAAGAWLDEICKWKTPKQSWIEGIMPSLRSDLAGDRPRALITTTPKPIDILQEWLRRDDGTVHIVRGSTFDNQNNLSAHMVRELRTRYEGTKIGRQELYGEMVDDIEGALFSRKDLEDYRVFEFPDDVKLTVVGVDPSLTGEDDEMGVVVVSRTRDNHMYVIADRSLMAVGRDAALHAWRAVAEFGADLLVYEANLGKRWMDQVFRDAYIELSNQGIFPIGSQPPMKGIDAKIGKKTRGEAVAMRSEQGRLHMVGRNFEKLEDQLVGFAAWDTNESPDRLDAMVHACRHLMATEKNRARMSSPGELMSTTLAQLLRSDAQW